MTKLNHVTGINHIRNAGRMVHKAGMLTMLIIFVWSSSVSAQPEGLTRYGQIAWEESAVPVRPGLPGKIPFWNGSAKRFIYAPAFDFQKAEGAVSYRFEIVSKSGGEVYRFESKMPWAPLTPVWKELPVGQYTLKVTGISKSGDILGPAGERTFYRAAPFNGIYHEPVLPYAESAMVALGHLMNEDYTGYWLKHQSPDPDYLNYRFPAKIYSALVIGAVTHARLVPGTSEAEKSTRLARIVADFMLSIRFPSGTAWEYFVPTYYSGHTFIHNGKNNHMDPVNNFTTMGVDAGNAFLDLFDLTREEKYLDAAVKIAQTYLKNQMENGSWYQFVHHATNKPVAENIAIPTAMMNYFDRLRLNYQIPGLEAATQKALKFILDNPVKTFDWQGQFEDVYARPPYKNLSREQACELAVYLLNNSRKNRDHVKLAEELIRFSEDQFVIWEQPVPLKNDSKGPGWNSANWITPCVQEQYVFWQPVNRSAGIMLETFWRAYEVTKNEMYLAKARSIANAITVLQEAHDGRYPTFSTAYKRALWLNSSVYPARVMMNLHDHLNRLGLQ